jgi:hypothetical protein
MEIFVPIEWNGIMRGQQSRTERAGARLFGGKSMGVEISELRRGQD